MHEETIARARELARSTYASSEASERRPDARAPSARRPPAQARPVRRSHSQPQPSSQRPLERSTSSPARLVPSDYEVDGSPYRLDASSGDEEELPATRQPQPQRHPQESSRSRGAATPARGSPAERPPQTPLPPTPAQPPPAVSPTNSKASPGEAGSSPNASRVRRSRSMTARTSVTSLMDATATSDAADSTATSATAARRSRSLSLPRTPPRRARTRVDPLSPVTESPAAAGAAALSRARAAAAAAAATATATAVAAADAPPSTATRGERGSGGGGGGGGGGFGAEARQQVDMGGTVGKEEDLLGRLCADEAKKRYDTLSPRRGARAAQRDNIAELVLRERARFMSPPSADAVPAPRSRSRSASGTPGPAPLKPALRVRRAVLGLLRGASRRSNAAAAAVRLTVEGAQDGRVPTPARSVFRF